MSWDFASIISNWRFIGIGLIGTLQLFAVCIVATAALGLVVGAGRYAANPLLRLPATAFVEFFRNTPVIVLIIWFYFAFPILTGVKLSAFWASFLGIALNAGAFSAEIFRGGMQSLPRGQWDAARAIGMSYAQLMRRVILPQAIKRMLPAFTNRGVEVMKGTALASIVAYFELLHSARVIAAANFNPIEAYTTVGVLFLALVWPLTLFAGTVERRLRASE